MLCGGGEWPWSLCLDIKGSRCEIQSAAPLSRCQDPRWDARTGIRSAWFAYNDCITRLLLCGLFTNQDRTALIGSY